MVYKSEQMKQQKSIDVHVHSLAQLIEKSKSDFSDIRSFILYKKQEIYAQRNHYLSQFTLQDITQNEILNTEHGKPYLNTLNPCYFNHSHSQKNYALAMSHGVKNIGVDIEDLDRNVRFEALANHAFHPQELAHWNDVEQSSEYWFKVWTTKEAVLKAAGLGIRINLNEFDTQVHPEQNGGICSHPEIGAFAYQNFSLNSVMLTVAWQFEQSYKGSQFPQIHIFQH